MDKNNFSLNNVPCVITILKLGKSVEALVDMYEPEGSGSLREPPHFSFSCDEVLPIGEVDTFTFTFEGNDGTTEIIEGTGFLDKTSFPNEYSGLFDGCTHPVRKPSLD